MNKGDKVRVVRNTVSEFGASLRKGVTGVIDPNGDPDGVGGGYIAVTELSNDSVGLNLRIEDLELISEEAAFKVGDRVKILASATKFLSDTIGRLGTVIGANGPRSLRVDVDDYTNGKARSAWYYSEEELELVTEEKQAIEVGDTVKATHAESGSVIQGVASYVDLNNDDLPTNIEIEVNLNTIGTLDLYTYQGWTFELVAKKEVPKPEPKVGDLVEDAASLPVGTVTRTNDFSGTYLHTEDGWRDQTGYLFGSSYALSNVIIVYLPPSASE